MTLLIRKNHLDEIVGDSLHVYPKEACGILGGKINNIKLVEIVFRAKNILDSESRYEIEPEEQFNIFEEIEKLNLKVVGFYHSHPYWEPTPSDTDVSLAFYKKMSYTIYSVMTRTLASYIWNGESFIPEKVILM